VLFVALAAPFFMFVTSAICRASLFLFAYFGSLSRFHFPFWDEVCRCRRAWVQTLGFATVPPLFSMDGFALFSPLLINANSTVAFAVLPLLISGVAVASFGVLTDYRACALHCSFTAHQ
jgi:hypothetical protein